MIEFVTTPTEEWLGREIANCKSQLLISSPYVGGWLPTTHQSLRKGVKKLLLTRTDLRDFASGASDLKAVRSMASDGTEIISSHRLHAKIYVMDHACCLITSANATFSGMRKNLECGVVIRDEASVVKAANLVLTAFGSSDPVQRWNVSDLDSLIEPVRLLRASLPPSAFASSSEERALPEIGPSLPVGQALRENLSGWTLLAFEGLQQQQASFDLASFVETCAPLAAARYPYNRNVRAKLRQQLQRLRDLGIVEFLGGGTYRRR